ncbi:MAG TPA: DUF6489 family protein [Acetobacteraceae bacterium]|nr:DUF6489 family protein [Acetobacteraceae bacterium]
MKITLDVDCTPEEARAFFGLPDVKPLQEAMLKEVEQRLKTSLAAMQPEALFRMWLPDASTLEPWRQFFANLLQAAGQPKTGSS